MHGRPPSKWVWEDRASEIVRFVLGGEFKRNDENRGDGAVDFLGETSNGVIALEITSIVDRHLGDLKEDFTTPEWVGERLGCTWSFTTNWGAPRPSKSFWSNLCKILEPMEFSVLDGEHMIFGGEVGYEDEALIGFATDITRLRNLGLQTGWVAKNGLSQRGSVSIGFGGFLASGDPSREVQRHIGENLEKLLAVPAEERHLFLWVHDSQVAMVSRLVCDINPAVVPDFRGLDQIWLSLWQGNAGLGTFLNRTWTTRPNQLWRLADPRIDHPE